MAGTRVAADGLSDADTPQSILDAREALVQSLRGVQLEPRQYGTVQWLLTWDQPTLYALADIVERVRALGADVDAARRTHLREVVSSIEVRP